LVLTAEISVRL
jgi:hypothetical protein